MKGWAKSRPFFMARPCTSLRGEGVTTTVKGRSVGMRMGFPGADPMNKNP